MKTSRIVTVSSFSLLLVFASTLLGPTAALAGSTGRKNTAIGLTAGTVYAAMRGKKTAAVGLGAASVYAWSRYSKARKAEIARRSYGRGYSRGYRVGEYRVRHNRGRHVGWSHSRYYRGAAHRARV